MPKKFNSITFFDEIKRQLGEQIVVLTQRAQMLHELVLKVRVVSIERSALSRRCAAPINMNQIGRLGRRRGVELRRFAQITAIQCKIVARVASQHRR